MIGIVLAILLGSFGLATRWRALSRAERLWAALAWLCALGTFAVPTTAATSSWRPIARRLVGASLLGCVVLIVAGAFLLRARHAARRPGIGLLPIFAVLAVPLVFVGAVALLWRLG